MDNVSVVVAPRISAGIVDQLVPGIVARTESEHRVYALVFSNGEPRTLEFHADGILLGSSNVSATSPMRNAGLPMTSRKRG